ncbi:unnamed protein product [Owenia fusiformis]|uniref:Uncharacterized protein n=1 Tax=Owenia fusiformis TaxID=6347 RepID=A0A8S4NV30_OWEFU|nr:unnamed protein product [Owenia fusiformis]
MRKTAINNQNSDSSRTVNNSGSFFRKLVTRTARDNHKKNENKKENTVANINNPNKMASSTRSGNKKQNPTDLNTNTDNQEISNVILAALDPKFDELFEQLRKTDRKVDEINQKLEARIESSEKKLDKIETQLEKPEELRFVRELFIRDIELDIINKKRNLIMFDLPENQENTDLKEAVESRLQQLNEGAHTTVQNCYRIGRPTTTSVQGGKSQRPRPVLIQFESEKEANAIKRLVWSKKAKSNVRIGEDLPEDARAIQNLAYKLYTKEAKQQRKKVKWVGVRVYIDGNPVNMDDIYKEIITKRLNKK